MARFVFKLEAVLRQRQQIEQQKLRDLAVRQQQAVALEQELRALNDSAEQATSDLRSSRLVGPIDLAFLSAHRRFMGAMGRQAFVLAQKIASAQKLVDQARTALADAAKNRKAIEKIREKHLDLWKREQVRKEQDLLDEVGMQIAFGHLTEDNR